jgi:hypothetical protein
MSEVRGDYATRFQNLGDAPMGKPVSVALPADVDAAVRSLSGGARSDWLRRVICDAARRELMGLDAPSIAAEPAEVKPARRRRKSG